MSTNYPSALDSLTNPATTDPVNSPSHAVQHANANDAIEALQAKVGTDNSLITTSIDYRIRQLESNPTGTANKITQLIINNTGATLPKGKAVYASGSVGASGQLRVSLSSNTAEATSSKTFGVLAENITNGGQGTVVTEGLLQNIDTTGASDGDPIWLGTNGGLIFGLANKPYAPAHLVFLGTVVRGGNANNGSIFVKVQNGFELEELHNVAIASLADKDLVAYDNATGLWKNKTFNSLDIATQTYVNSAITSLSNTVDAGYVQNSDVGNPNGVAPLDSNSLIPDAYIPSAITRDSELSSAISTEVTNRNTAISSAISTEVTNRNSAISTAVSNLVNSAPSTLDTLSEIATALGNDANLSTTLTNAIAGKVSKSGGDTISPSSASVKGLSILGVSSQTANLQDWTTYGGSSSVSIDNSGTLNVSKTAAYSVGSYPRININNEAGWASGLVFKVNYGSPEYSRIVFDFFGSEYNNSHGMNYISGRSGFSNHWFRNSSNAVQAVISDSGKFGINNSSPSAMIDIINNSANTIGLIVKGAASQTASLQEWRNSSDSSLLGVDSLGNLNIGAGSNNIWKIKNQSSAVMEWQPVQGFMFLPYGSSNRPVTIQGAASQTGDLTQWQNSVGTVLLNIRADGSILSSLSAARSDAIFDVSLPSGQQYPGVLVRSNTSWVTALNPTGLDSYWQARFTGIDTTTIPIIITGKASQTANLTEWRNSAGNALVYIRQNGSAYFTDRISGDNGISINNASGFGGWTAFTNNAIVGISTIYPSSPGLIIRGVASQTANLTEWQNSAGTVYSGINAAGQLFYGATSITQSSAINLSAVSGDGTNATYTATSSYTGSNPFIVGTKITVVSTGVAGFNGTFTITSIGGTSGAYTFTVPNTTTGTASIGYASPSPGLSVIAANSSTTPISIRGATNQGAALTEWQNATGVLQGLVASSGNRLYMGTSITAGALYTATATLNSFPPNATTIGLLIKGFTSQTADLTQWQNSAGTVLASVNSAGKFVGDGSLLTGISGGLTVASVSSNITLQASYRYFVDTTAARTLTLPASPPLGTEIQILDASGTAGTYNITVSRNGNLINGNAGNLLIDTNGGWYTLVYTGSTYGWKVG